MKIVNVHFYMNFLLYDNFFEQCKELVTIKVNNSVLKYFVKIHHKRIPHGIKLINYNTLIVTGYGVNRSVDSCDA